MDGRTDGQTDGRTNQPTNQSIGTYLIIHSTCLQSLKSNRVTVHDLQQKHIFHQIMNLTLTFDQMTLTSLQILALVDVHPHTKFCFDPTYSIRYIDKNVRLLRTNGPTNQPTNQPTNKTIHRDASQSLDVSKIST